MTPELAPTPAREMIRAPFTTEQVDALNAFQCSGRMHPFTCGGEHAPGSPRLIAHTDGWHCSDPYGEGCDYRQDWAHPFMASPEAWPRLFRPGATVLESPVPAPGAEPAPAPLTRVEIDLNVRARGTQARVGYEDADGPLQPGQQVEVYESESGLTGAGTVTAVNPTDRLAWVAVEWTQLRTTDGTETGVTTATAQVGDVVAGDTPGDTEPAPTAPDFDGCSRMCRKAGSHTRASGCEFQPEPEPAITLMRTRVMDDGYPSLIGERIKLTDLAAQIEAALRTVHIRLGPNALDMLQRGETVGLSGAEYADLARAAIGAITAQEAPHG